MNHSLVLFQLTKQIKLTIKLKIFRFSITMEKASSRRAKDFTKIMSEKLCLTISKLGMNNNLGIVQKLAKTLRIEVKITGPIGIWKEQKNGNLMTKHAQFSVLLVYQILVASNWSLMQTTTYTWVPKFSQTPAISNSRLTCRTTKLSALRIKQKNYRKMDLLLVYFYLLFLLLQLFLMF